MCNLPCSYEAAAAGTAVCVSPGTAGAASGPRAAAGPGHSEAAALTASGPAAGADAAYGWMVAVGAKHSDLQTHAWQSGH